MGSGSRVGQRGDVARLVGLLASVALAVFVGAGCSSLDPVPLTCIPGAQLACACPGGTSSVQLCTTAGALGPCACPDAGVLDVVAAGDAVAGDVPTPDASADAPELDVERAVDAGASTDVVDVVDVVDAGALDAAPRDAGPDVVDAPDASDVAQAPEVLVIPCVTPETFCPDWPACVRLDTDPRHCGSCSTVCLGAANGAPACASGACALRCFTGFGDCNRNAADGCETSLDSAVANCGACGYLCADGQRCTGGRCSNICSGTSTYCGGSCVDLASNTRNCGRCGNVCPAGASDTASCVSGTCVLTCDAAHGNCDGNPANGCETLIITRANCGGCGVACPGSLACANVGTGEAPILRCGCTSTALTACGGACVNVLRDPANCGVCGHDCGPRAFCNNLGACLSCGNNVDGVPLTQCGNLCVDLNTSGTNCGTCDHACAPGFCNSGACRG